MARSVAITKALATAAADNNISLSQSPGAAGNLTITGAAASGGVATLDSQRRVIITSAGNDSAKTFTIIGTNDNGSVIRDSFTGANTGIAQSNLDFKTVRQVSISAASAGAVKVGTNGVGSCPWQLFNSQLTPPHISLNALLNSGTATIDIEYTYDEFLPGVGTQPAIAYAGNSPTPQAIVYSAMTGLTASTDGALDFPFRGWRFTIKSGTGSWTVTGTQAGVAGP